MISTPEASKKSLRFEASTLITKNQQKLSKIAPKRPPNETLWVRLVALNRCSLGFWRPGTTQIVKMTPRLVKMGHKATQKHTRIEKLDPQTPSISAIKPPCQLEMNATNRTIRTQNQATMPTWNERNEPYHTYTHKKHSHIATQHERNWDFQL